MNDTEQSVVPVTDGWFQAGMEIASLLSLRPEVRAKGIVDAVKELLFALDRKLKAESAQDPKVLEATIESQSAQIEAMKAELSNARAKRDFVIGVALLNEAQQIDDAEFFQHVKSGVGARKLSVCMTDALKKIESNERSRD